MYTVRTTDYALYITVVIVIYASPNTSKKIVTHALALVHANTQNYIFIQNIIWISKYFHKLFLILHFDGINYLQ